VKTRLQLWPHEVTIDTFGGKPVLDVWGEQTFAEVAIVRIFCSDGWSARWLETYAASGQWPRVLTQWHPGGIKHCMTVSLDDPRVTEAIQSVIEANDGKSRGCWDAVAWREDQIVFCETKRHKKDRLTETQKCWVEAALDAGFSTEHFLIIEWDSA